MKKFYNLILTLVFVLGMVSCASQKPFEQKWVKDPRVEIVNEQTVIFRDVVKIEITSNNISQTTYVYDLKRFKPVTVSKGSFAIDLKRGDYLIQSDRKITKTRYDVIIE